MLSSVAGTWKLSNDVLNICQQLKWIINTFRPYVLSVQLSRISSLFLQVRFFFLFFLFRAAPVDYGSSQAKGLIRAIAAGLCHSHGNVWSELCLWPTLQLRQHQIFNPLNRARDRTHIVMGTSWVHYWWATIGTPAGQILKTVLNKVFIPLESYSMEYLISP